MNNTQLLALLLLVVFYGAYYKKTLLQKKKGIKTNQLGIGNKNQRTIRVEKGLRIASMIIVPIEVISILYNQSQEQLFFKNLGLILIGLGVVFFCMAMWHMRDNWRAGIPATDQTELVTTGIYKWSRNPAFLGFDLTYIGVLIAFYNPVLLVVTIWVMVMMHLQIIEEEKFLKLVFKEAYEVYCQRTGRYLWLV